MYFEDVLTFLQSSINPYLFVETLQIFLSNQSNVYYHMFVQIALGCGCIFTLVAFVWFFSTMYFQMPTQIACLWGCIITLVAFVWLFFTVGFQMCPQSAGIKGCICSIFRTHVNVNVSSKRLHKRMHIKSHWLQLQTHSWEKTNKCNQCVYASYRTLLFENTFFLLSLLII